MKTSRISFSGHGCLLSTAVWGLSWIAVAAVAFERVRYSRDLPSVVGLILSATLGAAATWLTLRLARATGTAKSDAPTEKEPWYRRVTGWFAAIVWCGAAILWNFSIIQVLLHIAHEGRGWFMIFLLPWSLIGWFLMFVLFTGLGVVVDSLITMLWGGSGPPNVAMPGEEREP
jgi:hypothetical protein